MPKIQKKKYLLTQEAKYKPAHENREQLQGYFLRRSWDSGTGTSTQVCVIVREVGTGVGVLNGHHSRRDHAHLFGPTLGIREREKEGESGGETQTMTLIILIAVLLIFGVQ